MRRPLDAALAYAEMGYPVFPIQPGEKRPLVDFELGITRGLKQATTDPRRIQEIWQKHPKANVAIAPGPNVLILDADSDEALLSLLLMAPTLSEAPRSRGSKGGHIWVRIPEGIELRSRARAIEEPPIDLRGLGKSYVVAPPSRHPSGTTYHWIVPLRPPANLPLVPPRILEAILPPPPPPAPTRPPSKRETGKGRERRYALKELRSRVEQMAATPEGQRHNELVRHAVALRAWINQGVLEEGEVWEELTYAARLAGLPEAEIKKVLEWSRSVSSSRSLS